MPHNSRGTSLVVVGLAELIAGLAVGERELSVDDTERSFDTEDSEVADAPS